MSKYIDADLYVEMQIYDDEHEEWSIWNGTIEELLDQWTEEGCPTPIKVSEDCISRADLPKMLNGVVLDDCDQIVDEFLEEHECDELWNTVRALRDFYEWTIDAPSVVPITEQSSMVGEWIEVDDGRVSCKCSICKEEYLLYEEDVLGRNYCPNCGAKMKV